MEEAEDVEGGEEEQEEAGTKDPKESPKCRNNSNICESTRAPKT